MIEPKRIKTSLIKEVNLIFGSFVVLYTTENETNNGISHSIDC
jgi:hypothetical protein